MRDTDDLNLPNQVDLNTSSTVDDRLRRYDLSCNRCPPHKGENEHDRPKHWKTKPRYKDKRG